MRTISQDNLLPLWETVSTTATVTVAATAPLSKSESKDSSAKMILVSVSEELENVLREVARYGTMYSIAARYLYRTMSACSCAIGN